MAGLVPAIHVLILLDWRCGCPRQARAWRFNQMSVRRACLFCARHFFIEHLPLCAAGRLPWSAMWRFHPSMLVACCAHASRF